MLAKFINSIYNSIVIALQDVSIAGNGR